MVERMLTEKMWKMWEMWEMWEMCRPISPGLQLHRDRRFQLRLGRVEEGPSNLTTPQTRSSQHRLPSAGRRRQDEGLFFRVFRRCRNWRLAIFYITRMSIWSTS